MFFYVCMCHRGANRLDIIHLNPNSYLEFYKFRYSDMNTDTNTNYADTNIIIVLILKENYLVFVIFQISVIHVVLGRNL